MRVNENNSTKSKAVTTVLREAEPPEHSRVDEAAEIVPPKKFVELFKTQFSGKIPQLHLFPKFRSVAHAAQVNGNEIAMLCDQRSSVTSLRIAEMTDRVIERFGGEDDVQIAKAIEVLSLHSAMLRHFELLTVDS